MDEEQKDIKQAPKVTGKKGLIVVLVVALILSLILPLYIKFRDDYVKISEKNVTYSVVVDQNGNIKYIKTNEDGSTEEVTAADMAEDFKEILKGYIDCKNDEEYTEMAEYLINAETVTKLPYIDSLADDPSQLNGIIKFYRYTSQVEADEAIQEYEEEESTINPKEIFYIGDSWIKDVEDYIKNSVSDEYSDENQFWYEEAVGATDDKYSNFNLKDKIDSVNTKVSAIVVMLGLYDASEEAATRMNEIIDFLSTTYPEKTTYILKIPHVGEKYENGDIDASDLNAEIDRYNSDVLKHCAELSNVNFIDATSEMVSDNIYLDSKYVKNDGITLKNTGKAVFYENIKECIVTGKSSSSTEKCRLTFIKRDEFNQKKNNYTSSGNKEIFKYFTIDEEGQIIIAFGREEKKTITTDDAELTVDMVREESGEENYTGNAQNGFSMVRYTISERPIDYLSLVEQYIMPSNLLYAFLIQTERIDFVEAIASLAYQSEIDIGIYDNESLSRDEEKVTYIKKIDMDVHTQLNFDNLQTTNPAINKSKLSNYNNIPYRCYASTSTKKHRMQYFGEERDASYTIFSEDTYVTGENNGLITELGEKGTPGEAGSAKIFTINYNKVVTSNSISTYGVTLADTWIARWKSTYKHENCEPSYSANSGPYENVDMKKYTTTTETLNAFNATKKSEISSQLNNHAKELKNNAVEQIYNNTSFTPITIDDLNLNQRKEILDTHIKGCSACSQCIEAWYTGGSTYEDSGKTKPSIDTIYNAVIDESLKDTIVEDDYWRALNNEVTNRNSRNKETFKNELKNGITYLQTLTGTKWYEDIQYASSYSRESTRYARDENVETDRVGERFSEVFNNSQYHNAKMHVIERTEWFWEYIRENEDTAKLEDILRLLLNIATDSTDFGEFTAEDINNILKAFEPKQYVTVMGAVSPFGCEMSREDFIAAAQSYEGGSNYYRLADAAGDFYDVCAKHNVNPGLAFAWACVETGYGGSIPDNNLFGMAIYNGASSGARYSTYAESIEDFCQWVLNNVDSGSTLSQAQEFATVNSKFQGTAESNIYVLFCRYMYLGDKHYSDEPDFDNPAGTEYYKSQGSTWGQGGRIYLYHMYELGGLYEGEYAERCGHPNADDPTTLQEKADYVEYCVNQRIKIAKTIFGNNIFIGGSGEYKEATERDIRGYYTSSSGRTYTEWIQSSNTTWGNDTIKSFPEWGTMAQCGCPIYAAAILLSSVGIDATPGDINEIYTGNEPSTVQKKLDEYNVNKTALAVSSRDVFIEKLLEGYGFATYVNSSSPFTGNKHWIVVADIRTSELGSSYGYDVYVLSSTTTGVRETRWHPIENVIDCLVNSGTYGTYISD